MRGLITNQTATISSQIMDKTTIKEGPDGTEDKDSMIDNNTEVRQEASIANVATQAPDTVSETNTKNPVEEGIRNIVIK